MQKLHVLLLSLLFMNVSQIHSDFRSQTTFEEVVNDLAENLMPMYMIKKFAFESGRDPLFLKKMQDHVENVTPEEMSALQNKAHELTVEHFQGTYQPGDSIELGDGSLWDLTDEIEESVKHKLDQVIQEIIDELK